MWRAATGLVALFSIVTSACASTPTQVQTAAPETATAAPQATTGPASPQAAEIEAVPTPTVIRQPNPLTTTVIDLEDRLPPPAGGVPAPTRGFRYQGSTEEYCSGVGDHSIDMAFRAVVRTVDRSSVAPWVTFDVTAWYTREVQTVMALWASDFPGQPGQEWLIASSQYLDTIGDVYWCESVPATAESIAEWDERYGGSVRPDSRVTENPPSPAVLDLIADGEALWRAADLDGYSAVIGFVDLDTYDRRACGATSMRITVEAGQVVQAYDPGRQCRVDPAHVVTIDDLFALTRETAGLAGDLADGRIAIDEDYGFVERFAGSDRSLDISLGVTEFIPEAQPLRTLGGIAGLEVARELWEASGVGDYTVTFEIECGCSVEPYTVTVRDGVPVDPPAGQPGLSLPFTVDDLFDFLAARLRPGGGLVRVVYDEGLGYPTYVRLDKGPRTTWDDIKYFVRDFTVD